MYGCSDGNDGVQGEPGKSEETSVIVATEVNKFQFETVNVAIDGQSITLDFTAENEKSLPVTGIKKVKLYAAKNSELGIEAANKVGGYGEYPKTSGSKLSEKEPGSYSLSVPITTVTSADDIQLTMLMLPHKTESGMNIPGQYFIAKYSDKKHTVAESSCNTCHNLEDLQIGWHPYPISEIANCNNCHGDIIADENTYSQTPLHTIGHKLHQDNFNTGFDVLACSSCHSTPVVATNRGCNDCHDNEASKSDALSPSRVAAYASPEQDWRNVHQRVNDRKSIKENHPITISDINYDASKKRYCAQVKVTGLTPTLEEQFTAQSQEGATQTIYDGSYFLQADPDSNRITATLAGWRAAYSSYSGNIATVCSDFKGNQVEKVTNAVVAAHIVLRNPLGDGKNIMLSKLSQDITTSMSETSCIGCHNAEYTADKIWVRTRKDYKTPDVVGAWKDHSTFGDYSDGGATCYSCHNPGAGYGENGSLVGAIHSYHFGINADERNNLERESLGNNRHKGSTEKLAANNCIVCHTSDINLDKVPTRYLKSKSGGYNSPTAEACRSCHSAEVAKVHMTSQGGEFNSENSTNGKESCNVCHGKGRSADIAKYHKIN